MHALTVALASVAAEATPTPTMTVDPDVVTPGFAGFVAIALLSVVVIFLIVDMLRRIRRAGYRSEIAEELDSHERDAAAAASDAQARAAVEASDTDDQDIDPPSR